MNENSINVSVLTFKDWFDSDRIYTRPKEGMHGGGIVTKYLYVKACLPDLHTTDDCSDPNLKQMLLIEPMFIERDYSEKLEALKKHRGIKLLWAEEQAVFRWNPKQRERIFRAVDGLVACNLYQQQLLQVIAGELPVYVLRSPIPEIAEVSDYREKRVVAVSKIGLQKNSDAILKVFESLPEGIEKVFLGNAGLWGSHRYLYDLAIEEQIAETADRHITGASLAEVSEILSTSAVYLTMTIYDVGSLAFLEAGMAGCACLCWDYHPMFDEYSSVVRFRDVDEAVRAIEKQMEPPLGMDTEMRSEIIEKHSAEQFADALKSLFLEVFYYAE